MLYFGCCSKSYKKYRIPVVKKFKKKGISGCSKKYGTKESLPEGSACWINITFFESS